MHLNIENAETSENKHISISPDERYSGEFDHVFDYLQECLNLYNFHSITRRHSPAADDRQMFKEMKYWNAMYQYALAAYADYFDVNLTCIGELCQPYRAKLIELLKEDGIDEHESENLSPSDLFELAHSIIEKNNYIHF